MLRALSGKGLALLLALASLGRQGAPGSGPFVLYDQQGRRRSVFAGLYDNQGYRWWRMQTAGDGFGWIAGVVGGRPTIAQA